MTLCALTFSNTSFNEEALKYLLWVAAKLTRSMRKCLTVSGAEKQNILVDPLTIDKSV